MSYCFISDPWTNRSQQFWKISKGQKWSTRWDFWLGWGLL